jgi:RNA polymerase sigma factor (sigma-70 family)
VAARANPSAERFREVVLPHLADALAFARWLTGSADDAEDVVQEACLRAYAGIGTYAGGNARAWLLAIVRNACHSWLARNRGPRLTALDDVTDADLLAARSLGDEDPEAAMIARADVAEVEAAIAALPPLFREALVLRDINGLTYREIADLVAVPIGTVMSRLSRARAILVRQLGGRDDRS